MEVIMTNEEKILEGRGCSNQKKFLYKMGTDYSFSNYCWWSNYHAF